MLRVISLIRSINIKRVRLYQIAALVLFMIAFTALSTLTWSDSVVKGLADNLIRFHVVANSDSPDDQSLKLRVRDKVIDYMNEKLTESRNINDTRAIILANLSSIEKIAYDEIEVSGKQYPVKASLGSFSFPTKIYGDITLPAGKYQALRVEIGKAEGANWWCVLFPPLCFVDATHGTISADVKNELKDAIGEEDYKLIVNVDSDEQVPIKIKFKVIEFFENSRISVAGTFESLLKRLRL